MPVPPKLSADDLTGAETLGGLREQHGGVLQRFRTSIADVVIWAQRQRDMSADIAQAVKSYWGAHKAELKGDQGAAATIAVRHVATGAAGSPATVTNAGTQNAAVLDFSIPRGATGVNAEAPRRAVLAVAAAASVSRVTWTYSEPFAAGVAPIVEALVMRPTGSTVVTYNVQIVGDPTNTTCVLEVSALAASGVGALLGALLYAPVAAGTKLHVTARAP